jgi:phosphoribosylformylglycinamidine synthase
MTGDSVTQAAATPSRPQPYKELGLTADEYARIKATLGRRPTDAELALYSVMWSEHCSYKSSKVHLRQFAVKAPETDVLLAGIGSNAGVVDIGHGYAVTFKIESHNHPSYVEPHQGAATGVGGIVRDILAMGARPVAVMDALRFGPADAHDTARVLPGVVGGISFYGNCLGLPNIGGELDFDPCYAGNPLINALCVGVMRHDDLQEAAANGPGNKVILFGSRTGPDGIGGASVLASASFSEGKEGAKRPSVQVGDPFMEKLLIECCLEAFAAGLVSGIQDLGAAGVACATTELAAAGTGGMRVWLDKVPLRDPSLGPPEILMSESQERMAAVVEPRHAEEFLAICAKWEIQAAIIGEVTDDGRLTMTWHGETVVDIPPASAADEGPVYERPIERPGSQDMLIADIPDDLPRPGSKGELRQTVLTLLASPGLAAKNWVTDQYDRYVRGDTVLAMPEDGGLLRIDEATGLGIALATDGNGRYCKLDPYRGTQLVLSEAFRNVAVTGARPLAVTNCLNFGSPEDPAVMWQFAEAVRGLADGCAALNIPVTGGNVSFYNQTGSTAIHPTPVIGVLGVHDDVRRRLGVAFPAQGSVVLLGRTEPEFGGSAWADVLHGHLGGEPPEPDLAAELRLAALLAQSCASGLLAAAHDLSDGGLAVALAESCLRGGTGCRISLPGDPFIWLFSESTARAVVAVRPGQDEVFAELCATHDVRAASIGSTGGDRLLVEDCFEIPLAELAAVHEKTLPALFGGSRVRSQAQHSGLCRPASPTRVAGRAWRPCCGRWTRVPSRTRPRCGSPCGTCYSCWPAVIRGARWRSGSRRWRRCSAWKAPGTPAARRPTWWKWTRSPGSGWLPGGSAGRTRCGRPRSSPVALVLTWMVTCLWSDRVARVCGVFGVWAPAEDVAKLTYFGLYALQHRGQESAGIAVSDGHRIVVHKEMGLVAQAFDEPALTALRGHIAVGHCRYSTTGASVWANAQPTFRSTPNASLALGHNGNLINTRELAALLDGQEGLAGMPATSDTDVLTTLFVSHLPGLGAGDGNSVEDTAAAVLPLAKGAYSLVFMDEHVLYAARDPHGFRPLVLGRLDRGWVVASETAALDIVGAAFVREIAPGELIRIDENGVKSRNFAVPRPSGCLFELVYLARPDTTISGRGVHATRVEVGRRLAAEHPVEADLVIPVPESGTPAAIGYAEASGIPFGQGLVKNSYVGRTFIQPSQTIRQRGIKLKLNPLREAIAGRSIVVVDDSIVRGNTQRALVAMLREAGATQVHVRVASPPVKWPCFFGIDFASRDELIAGSLSLEEIRASIGADSLGYISLDGLTEATTLPSAGLCRACFNGEYPIPVAEGDRGKFVLEVS